MKPNPKKAGRKPGSKNKTQNPERKTITIRVLPKTKNYLDSQHESQGKVVDRLVEGVKND